jgi:hypothetical protein
MLSYAQSHYSQYRHSDCHPAKCCYAEYSCHYSNVVNVGKLSGIVLFADT